jgi:hypothetical protein
MLFARHHTNFQRKACFLPDITRISSEKHAFPFSPVIHCSLTTIEKHALTLSMTEDELKLELLKMDVQLRRKQVLWETPKGLALIAAALAAIFGAIFGVLGYKIGATPPVPPTPIIIQLPPVTK